MKRKDLPLIYACSGCSDVAQLANEVAVRLDHQGAFEMSCIAGVGGGVKPLVKTARSGRPVVAIDGCHLHCAAACLEAVGVTADEHVLLYEAGFRKHYGQRYGHDEVQQICDQVMALRPHLIATDRQDKP
ncbi:MAG: putative zinc-binding protein [Marinobacter sp.]|nr:putative zinc-binding protein [Marinobacter sp.]